MTQDPRAARKGDVLAVVAQSGPAVLFFDAASDRLLGAVETLAEPHELCFDPVRRLLWCTITYRSGFYHANDGARTELAVIDPDTRRVVEVVDLAPDRAPHGLALDAARGRLHVTVEGEAGGPGAVVVIDAETRRPVGRIGTGAPGSHWLTVDPVRRTGYVANKEAPFVSVLDLEQGVLTAKADVPGSEGIALSADGEHVFVAAPFGGSFTGPDADATPGIRIIDTKAAAVVDTLRTDHRVMPVHVTATGLLLAGEVRTLPDATGSARMAPGALTVFSADTCERLARFETGLVPLTIGSSPDGRIGYVAAYASSTVDVIDLEELRPLARISDPALGSTGAHGLAYIPRTA